MLTHRHNYLINQNPLYDSIWESIYFYASKFNFLFKIVIFNVSRHIEIRFQQMRVLLKITYKMVNRSI